jgi:hypothetical protein
MQKNEDPAEFYKPDAKVKGSKNARKKDEASREVPGEVKSSLSENPKDETLEDLPEEVSYDTGAVEVSTFFYSI